MIVHPSRRRDDLAAELVEEIRRDIASAPDCTRRGDCPERSHQSGCLSQHRTDAEIEYAITPADDELRNRRDAGRASELREEQS